MYVEQTVKMVVAALGYEETVIEEFKHGMLAVNDENY